jgi:hypothetical protein
MTRALLYLALFAALPSRSLGRSQNAVENGRYDVIWKTPSKDASGSMPIGNGEVVLNAWVEKATGDLLFYIARSDSLSEICRILKLGLIRVHFERSPFLNANDFEQHLRLGDGVMEVTGGGAKLSLFVDADRHAVLLKSELKDATMVSVTNESWRTEARTLPASEDSSAWTSKGAPFPLVESADHFFRAGGRALGWYHRNETSVVPTLWKNQSLTGLKGAFDPLIHRTFGGCLFSDELSPVSERELASPHPISQLTLVVATDSRQTSDLPEWESRVQLLAEQEHYETALGRTLKFWRAFWNRSTFDCSNPSIGQGYNLQRYVQACQGRGAYPIKFNGGYFTVEPKASGKPFNADWRAWGDAHWYQNGRHMVHPMLASGDFEMMDPFFRLYESNRVLAESRTELYHHAKGAYFPETMSVFGTYSGSDYGWDRTNLTPDDVQSPWWRYAWNQGPELVALMLDRWDYTRDTHFLKTRALPMAESVLNYFDTRFKRDALGKIILDPAQSVETYWYGVVNDMPTTSGLISITERLDALPNSLKTPEQAAFFHRMKTACPDLPFQKKNGIEELSPAQKFKPETSNVENPELYAIWPFRVVCLLQPKYLEEGKVAYENRLFHQDVGWGYDGNAAALLGLTEESARILEKKCANSNRAYRWPATWGPNFDWLPDQNHGGNLLETADLMLLQGESLESGGKIILLPSWPTRWDVQFKLHAPGNTTVECKTVGGKVVKLVVSPASRRKDIVIPAIWEIE